MSTHRIVIAGHVDHGKSTLIGKILSESSSVLEDRYKKVEQICQQRSMKFEYAFLLDAFEEEQKQGITIDKLEIPWISDSGDKYIFIDTPGHKEFIRNMISGASQANSALIMIDALEGVKPQTLEHTLILSLFGIREVTFVINKMDLINFSENIFLDIKNYILTFISENKLEFNFDFIPISAYLGENIFTRSSKLHWFTGESLISNLEKLSSQNNSNTKNVFNRLSIQDVYKFDDKRLNASLVLSGTLKENDLLNFVSVNTSSEISSFETWSTNSQNIFYQNDVVTFTTQNSLFLSKGEIAFWNSPAPQKRRELIISGYWFGKNKPNIQDIFTLKIANQKHNVKITNIFHRSENIFDLTIHSSTDIIFDFFEDVQNLGKGILLKNYETVFAFVVNKANELEHNKNTTKPFVAWLTGMSGSGKTTLAEATLQKLKHHHQDAIFIDGDLLRSGINSDLGFSKQDRLEQARRAMEITKLLVLQGHNVIVALITPYEESRSLVRKSLAPLANFKELYIKASLETCQSRDPKGLYRNLSTNTKNDLPQSHFEEPVNPDYIIDTESQSIMQCAADILSIIKK